MAKKYSVASNEFLKRLVKEHAIDGKVDWAIVAKEVREESGEKQNSGAIKTRYYRLMSQNSVKKSARSGEKTWKRAQKLIENLFASNYRMRAQLDAKKGKRRSSARMELLKKKNKELRDQITGLKKELKSHGPILNWYIQAQRGFKIAKAKKALIE